MPERPPSLKIGCDGFGYIPKEKQRLDELAVGTFARGAGKEFLSYLRSITIEAVCGPAASDAELRHREGARALIGIIETRLTDGLERRKKENG